MTEEQYEDEITKLKQIYKVYNDVHNQSREFFVKDYHRFREVMCSTKYTTEQKESSFESLATSYLRCHLTESDVQLFTSVSLEWEMRKMYEPIKVEA